MRTWRTVAIASFFFLCFCAAVLSQDKGSIRGTVVDAGGVPQSGVRVYARLRNQHTMNGFVHYVETDTKGVFRIDGLEFGQYGIFTAKLDANYPDTGSSFYSDNIFRTATISAALPSAEIRVRLGLAAGVLSGTVTNASNGAPVLAVFKLTRAASPNEWLATSLPSDYRVLLPPLTDVDLEVSARGFKTWSPLGPLRVQSGSETHLDISLEPSNDPSLKPSEFLVPEGYVGWVLLNYKVRDVEPVPEHDGRKVFKFPPSGTLSTSSPGPDWGAQDLYLYYSPDGSVREIQGDYRAGSGMIWGQHQGTRAGVLSQFGFFVGSEDQYKKYESRGARPGPIPVK